MLVPSEMLLSFILLHHSLKLTYYLTKNLALQESHLLSPFQSSPSMKKPTLPREGCLSPSAPLLGLPPHIIFLLLPSGLLQVPAGPIPPERPIPLFPFQSAGAELASLPGHKSKGLESRGTPGCRSRAAASRRNLGALGSEAEKQRWRRGCADSQAAAAHHTPRPEAALPGPGGPSRRQPAPPSGPSAGPTPHGRPVAGRQPLRCPGRPSPSA